MSSIKQLTKNAVGSLSDGYYKTVIKKAELDKIQKKKDLWSAVSLTQNQEKEIYQIYGDKAD